MWGLVLRIVLIAVTGLALACGSERDREPPASSDAGLDGGVDAAEPSSGISGTYCGDGGVACPASAPCEPLMSFGVDVSVCYEMGRERCGSLDCDCPDGMHCYIEVPHGGADEGFCLTDEEAPNFCSLPSSAPPPDGCSEGGVPTPLAECG